MRTYGHDKTIHGTTVLDVETDADGDVVAVWFRCQALPFSQTEADASRAESMRDMYADADSIPALHAVEVE